MSVTLDGACGGGTGYGGTFEPQTLITTQPNDVAICVVTNNSGTGAGQPLTSVASILGAPISGYVSYTIADPTRNDPPDFMWSLKIEIFVGVIETPGTYNIQPTFPDPGPNSAAFACYALSGVQLPFQFDPGPPPVPDTNPPLLPAYNDENNVSYITSLPYDVIVIAGCSSFDNDPSIIPLPTGFTGGTSGNTAAGVYFASVASWFKTVSTLVNETATTAGGLNRDLTVAFAFTYKPSTPPTGPTTTPIIPIIPPALTPPIFPTPPTGSELQPGFPIKVSVVMDTTVGTTKSLREMRVAQQQYPLWDIELLFAELLDQTQNETPYAPLLSYKEYQALVQTWLMMYGQTDVFAFACPWDNSRTLQLIGVGDAETVTFTAYRTWGSGANATLAPVGLINTITEVQINGVTVGTGTYSAGRDTITFTTPPGGGSNINVTFSYYYLCRFMEDEQDFEEFSKNRWTVPSLKFRAVYWP